MPLAGQASGQMITRVKYLRQEGKVHKVLVRVG